jgi:hypothetical protein
MLRGGVDPVLPNESNECHAIHWRLHIVRPSLHPVPAPLRHIHRCHFRRLLPRNGQASSHLLIAPHLTNQPQHIPCRNPATTLSSCRLNNTITAGALHPAHALPFRASRGATLSLSLTNQARIPCNPRPQEQSVPTASPTASVPRADLTSAEEFYPPLWALRSTARRADTSLHFPPVDRHRISNTAGRSLRERNVTASAFSNALLPPSIDYRPGSCTSQQPGRQTTGCA